LVIKAEHFNKEVAEACQGVYDQDKVMKDLSKECQITPTEITLRDQHHRFGTDGTLLMPVAMYIGQFFKLPDQNYAKTYVDDYMLYSWLPLKWLKEEKLPSSVKISGLVFSKLDQLKSRYKM
jgi:hypothetical protein